MNEEFNWNEASSKAKLERTAAINEVLNQFQRDHKISYQQIDDAMNLIGDLMSYAKFTHQDNLTHTDIGAFLTWKKVNG